MVKRLKIGTLLILTVVISMIVKSDAAIVIRQFNQMMLYSDTCYDYASECIMPSDLYTDTQRRINLAIYGQTAVVFSSGHFDLCYGNVNTPIFNSFKRYLTPLCPLAFSIAEWGGNGDLRYSFTPAIATKKLMNSGIPMSVINPLEVNAEYYSAMGCSFKENSYWGPLQINKSYLTPNSNKGYSCGYIPTDYYSWSDACQWTFHDKCEQIKNSWNKDYEFKNQYEVIAHTSIAHNSGGTHLTSKDFYLDKNWYPWKSSQAVFDYVSYITSGERLQIILSDADSYADNLLNDFRNGNESGALYKSISDCRVLSYKMNIDWSHYVKSHWLGNMTPNASLSGDALRNWEKVMYPIQSIWNYRVLERLYGLN